MSGRFSPEVGGTLAHPHTDGPSVPWLGRLASGGTGVGLCRSAPRLGRPRGGGSALSCNSGGDEISIFPSTHSRAARTTGAAVCEGGCSSGSDRAGCAPNPIAHHKRGHIHTATCRG